VPTLLVRGGISDVVSPEGVAAFLAVLPSAETVDVADAGHMVAGDQNDPFSSAVVEFLTRSLTRSRRRASRTGTGRQTVLQTGECRCANASRSSSSASLQSASICIRIRISS
jgi:hypothetical protein